MRVNKRDKIKIQEIAEKHGITYNEAKAIISSQFSFIREKLSKLTFEDGLTKEEFIKKKTNFNIPSIGKLYASYYIYETIQKNKKSLDE
jgi:hypothetical protein